MYQIVRNQIPVSEALTILAEETISHSCHMQTVFAQNVSFCEHKRSFV